MYFEELFEPIEVITYFQNKKIIPLKFRWNGRVYKIRQVNGHWREHLGTAQQHHFSVQVEGSDYFELLFDSADFSWQLARVGMEG